MNFRHEQVLISWNVVNHVLFPLRNDIFEGYPVAFRPKNSWIFRKWSKNCRFFQIFVFSIFIARIHGLKYIVKKTSKVWFYPDYTVEHRKRVSIYQTKILGLFYDIRHFSSHGTCFFSGFIDSGIFSFSHQLQLCRRPEWDSSHRSYSRK